MSINTNNNTFDVRAFESLLQTALKTPVGLKFMYLQTEKCDRKHYSGSKRIKKYVREYYFDREINTVHIDPNEDFYRSGRYIVIQVLTMKQYFSDVLKGFIKEERENMLDVLNYADNFIDLKVIYFTVKCCNKILIKSKIKLLTGNRIIINLGKRVYFKDLVIHIQNSKSFALAVYQRFGFPFKQNLSKH